MKIMFGMYLDGSEWSSAPASLGEISLGPAGMLQLLEGRLGLAGIEISQPERINQYMQKLIMANHPWYAASYQLDPWSTAKQLLAWRDELIMAGWTPAVTGSPRLEALSAVEQVSPDLAPGHADRLIKVCQEISKLNLNATLTLNEPRTLLPSIWQLVMDKLETLGIEISEVTLPPLDLTGKDIQVITGNDELTLAREVARYLAAAPAQNREVALICENDTTILDGMLHRYGLGAVGVNSTSRWRPSLQILPLFLEILWEPFNPQRFLELLLLPNSPIPSVIASTLIGSLQEEPGLGGPHWQKAWQQADEDVQQNKRGYYHDIDGKLDELRQLRVWLENEKFTVSDGVPEAVLLARCDWLTKRLSPKLAKNDALKIVLFHIQALKSIVKGKGRLARVVLSRILDSIISVGTIDDSSNAEVTDFAKLRHPGQLRKSYDTIIWWNFVDRGVRKNTYWSAEELAVFNKNGIAPDIQSQRYRETLAWQNAARYAGQRLLVFIPKTIAGEEVFYHPFLDELAWRLNLKPDKLVKTCEQLRCNGAWRLADRNLHLTSASAQKPETAFPGLAIGTNLIKPLRQLSYTQMASLLSCPLRWVLQYYDELKLPPTMNVSTGPLMYGKLAHKVIELLFAEQKQWQPTDASTHAEQLFSRLLPQMAGELLLDERSIDRIRFKETLMRSVKTLVAEINERELEVIATEKEFTAKFATLEFHGFTDLLLKDNKGKYFIIDMKWSSGTHYADDLKNGKALQLASYAWLVKSDNDDVQCAYYLFPKHKLLYDSTQDWQHLWNRATACYAVRMAEIQAGTILCGNNSDKELSESLLPLSLRSDCGFCNFAALCGKHEE